MDKSFYIYGAGIVATSIYTAIKNLHNRTPNAFLVSNLKGNPAQIEGIPVLTLSEIEVADDASEYLIATPEIHHGAIAESLTQIGIANEQLVYVDNQLENTLMEDYYSSLREFLTVSELLNDRGTKSESKSKEIRECAVFMAKCHVDKPLKKRWSMPEYIKTVQVGAALTDIIIAEIRDNVGENISDKNHNYCELTATYYVWKNSHAQYKGLCHYRRIFDLSEEQLQTLLAEHGEVDVILPYPSIHYPDISGQHKRYISESDWNAMLQAMKEVAPEYYEAYETDISMQNYFYNYNMLIAKREVFDDYCRFMFSVLERTEILTEPKGWERADRFAGYLGENLTTIYFRKNRDKLKVVHAGRRWLT